jgi:hypothetical protein
VYDMVYRPSSLEVHGNTFFADHSIIEKGSLNAAFSCVNSLLSGILLIVDNYPSRKTAPEEILTLMHINNGGQKYSYQRR